MKLLLPLGLILIALGVASIFVPIPRTDRKGIEVGDVSVGVSLHRKENVSPIVSGVLILAGAGLLIASRRGSR